jgi:hypothetical protein
MVVHADIPSYSEGRDRRITVQDQTEQKIARYYLKNKLKAERLWVWLKW